MKMENYNTHYEKIRIRKSLDFALVSLASAYKVEDGKMKDVNLVYGGVAPVPVKLDEVEALLEGKEATKELAKEAGELEVKDATPMEMNGYKVSQAKAVIIRLVENISK